MYLLVPGVLVKLHSQAWGLAVPQGCVTALLVSATLLFYSLRHGGLLWSFLLCRALLFFCPVVLLAPFTPGLVTLPSPCFVTFF